MSTDTLKISNGPWDAGTAIVNAVTGEGENFSDGDIWIFPTDDAGPVAICHKPGDAILIADAGTTFNRTGKTPSQLAERLEEAEMIISDLMPIALRTQRACDKSQVLNYDNPFDAECADVYGKKIQTARDFLTPPTNG